MRVVYYKREDGTIQGCHSVDSIPEDELSRRVDEYNRSFSGTIATVYDFEPGSFEEYLYNMFMNASRLQLDTLQDLAYELSCASSLVSELADQAKSSAMNSVK